MQIQKYHSQNWVLVAGILSLVFIAASWTFGEEPPLQQNRPERGGFMRQDPGGPMKQDAPEPRMMGSKVQGMKPGSPDGARRDLIVALLRPEALKDLALTPEQHKKLEDLQFTSEKETIQHRASLQILRMELFRLADSENPDRTAIDKKILEVTQEESSLLRSSIFTELNARTVLTAEQRTKFEQIMQNRIKGERIPSGVGMPQGQPFPRTGREGRQAQPPAAQTKP
jgi:Spy/CpxP family protein refolding chaperone